MPLEILNHATIKIVMLIFIDYMIIMTTFQMIMKEVMDYAVNQWDIGVQSVCVLWKNVKKVLNVKYIQQILIVQIAVNTIVIAVIWSYIPVIAATRRESRATRGYNSEVIVLATPML